MLTGEIRSQIDQIWNAFWSGGISNPLEVLEQITYLLFLKRLDEQEIAEELKANREKKPMPKRFLRQICPRFLKYRVFQQPRDFATVAAQAIGSLKGFQPSRPP